MSRRKTEAWLVEWDNDGQFFGLFCGKNTALTAIAQSGMHRRNLRLTPLVRRDLKAEAVVRAALQVKAVWDSPTAEWSRAVDVLGRTVDELQASRKKAKR